MPNFLGKILGQNCGGIIYICSKCGAAGCENRRAGEKCSNNITRDSGGARKNNSATSKVI